MECENYNCNVNGDVNDADENVKVDNDADVEENEHIEDSSRLHSYDFIEAPSFIT